MKRKIADCSQMSSEQTCSITIAGEENEVLDVAMQHAVAKHGHKSSPELREKVRSMLKDER